MAMKEKLLPLFGFCSLIPLLMMSRTVEGTCQSIHLHGLYGGSVHMSNKAVVENQNNTCNWKLNRQKYYDRMRIIIRHVKITGYSEISVHSGLAGPTVIFITPLTTVNQTVVDTTGDVYGININTLNGTLNELHFSFLSYNEVRATGQCPIHDTTNVDDFKCASICVNQALKCDRVVNCPDGADENNHTCPGGGIANNTAGPIIISLFVTLLVVVAIVVAYLCVRKMRHEHGLTDSPWTVIRYKIFHDSNEGLVESAHDDNARDAHVI